MKSLLVPVFLCIACISCTSCTSTFHAEGGRGALAKRGVARIVVDANDSGDAGCRRAVEKELRARGFQMTSVGRATLDVKLSDSWRWDLAMYLSELSVVFADADTGALMAQADYRNAHAHGWPAPSLVVEKLFQELDAKGVFASR